MKRYRPYIVQFFCITVLTIIGVLNIIEADYLRALTSAIYVFVCVQVVFAGYRFANLSSTLKSLSEANTVLQEELDEVYKERDAAIRRKQELECSSEHSRQDSIRWRDEKNKAEKECNKLRQENRHLQAEIERLHPTPRIDTSTRGSYLNNKR